MNVGKKKKKRKKKANEGGYPCKSQDSESIMAKKERGRLR